MYSLNSNLPAPYELNAQAAPSQPAMMARGGRAKHRRMVIAHFNPRELDVLDHLQGETERCPKTGLRSYSHLEELFKNPHIVANVHHHARKHHAMGGSAELEHLAEGGRHGDSEIALIGPHTHHLLNQLAGHSTRNPNTGHPEYWSLKNFLSGAWDTIKGAGAALAPVAGQALGTMFGGPEGAALGGAAGQGLSRLLGGGQNPSPFNKTLGEGAQSAWNAYNSGGMSPGQAFSHGIQKVGAGMGGGLGRAMQGFGSAYSQGQGLRDSLRQGAQSGFESMGGKQGLMNSAQNIMKGYGQPGGIKGAAMNEFSNYRNRFRPQMQPQQQMQPQPQFQTPTPGYDQ